MSLENIEAYIEGCEAIAFHLDAAVRSVQEKGNKPTILIPSRGAVPITIVALSKLKAMDPEHLLLDRHRTKYYPDNVFKYLSNGRIEENGPMSPEAEVVLYPFTADVTSEGKQEHLAQKLRRSATNAFLDLISGDRKTLDYTWYKFLMELKMRRDPHQKHELDPVAYVQSLERLESSTDRQTIIIDTVISGRASSQILEAFNELGHPVVPILAVNSVKGSTRFQEPLKNRIMSNIAWSQMPTGDVSPFIDFPLITEDKGAGLLGVAAINFGNFNREGFFHKIDPDIPSKFLPQSCVWTLPPAARGHRDDYVGTFHRFLDRCTEPSVSASDWGHTLDDINRLMQSHGEVDTRDIQAIADVSRDAKAKESSSHIITIDLPLDEARTWGKEFAYILSNPVAPLKAA